MTLAIDWPHDPGENQNRSPAPGPITLAIPWPHHPGENAAAWPHEPGDRQCFLSDIESKVAFERTMLSARNVHKERCRCLQSNVYPFPVNTTKAEADIRHRPVSFWLVELTSTSMVAMPSDSIDGGTKPPWVWGEPGV
jgi:hypothetical protein